MSKLDEYTFLRAVAVRVSSMNEVMKITRKQEEADTELCQQLTEATPKGILSLLKEEMIIDRLVKYGRADGRINLHDYPEYPRTLESLKEALEDLVRAWGGCVRYTTSDEWGGGCKWYIEAILNT